MSGAKLELGFHIGMGKTGTSAIQASLRDATAKLRAHGLAYLGMWWGNIDPQLDGPQGMEAAAKLPPAQLVALADRLLAHMHVIAQRDGVSHFLFSNEALFAHTAAFEPLYARLAEQVELRFVVFVREPRAWLASAYAQWGIRHREDPARVPDFGEWAAAHIGIYGGLRWWHRRFGPRLVARIFDPRQDVVAELLRAIGSACSIPSARVYETPEPALLALQAEHARRFGASDPAASFSDEVYDVEASGSPPTVEELVARHFDPSSVPALLSRWREVFDGIRDDLGLDLLAADPQGRPAPSPEQLRERLVECLVAIVLQQSRRIAALEARLDDRDERAAGSS